MKTKNIVRFLLVNALCIIVFFSCSLDEDPVTFRKSDDFYNNKSECEIGVRGVYAAAQWIYSLNYFELTEFPTDYCRTNKMAEEMHADLTLYDWDANHSKIGGFYSDAYAAINRFNSMIEKLSAASFLDEQTQSRMIAEVRFWRGQHYFNLVRVFGEIPVVLNETKSSTVTSYPKWTNEDIFKKVILPDLQYAETYLLEDASEDHRVSGMAAKGLLAKAYLWLASCGKYNVPFHSWVNEQSLIAAYRDSVKIKCEGIINKPKYGLYKSYYDLWTYAGKTQKDGIIETILAVNFEDANGEGCTYSSWFNNYAAGNAPAWDLTPGREATSLGGGFNVMSPTGEFWNEIANWDINNPTDAFGDKRDTTMFIVNYGNTADKDNLAVNPNAARNAPNKNTGVNFGTVKYRHLQGLATSTRGSCQMPILRYADVLLMYAEACLGDNAELTSGANGFDAFNRVRRRASENDNYSATYVTLDMILQERKVELCFEMDRWFDLVRTHSLKTTLDKTTISVNAYDGGNGAGKPFIYGNELPANQEEKRMFYPIPARALILNEGLIQNPLWR